MRDVRKDLTGNPERREGIPEVLEQRLLLRSPHTMYPLLSGAVPMIDRFCLGTR